jgi:hypothetical protein
VKDTDDVDEIRFVQRVDQSEGRAGDRYLAGPCHIAIVSQKWKRFELFRDRKDGRQNTFQTLRAFRLDIPFYGIQISFSGILKPDV